VNFIKLFKGGASYESLGTSALMTSKVRTGLSGEPAGQLPGAPTHIGRLNVTGVNRKYIELLKCIYLEGLRKPTIKLNKDIRSPAEI
jgi:hypothetical protein